MKVCSNIAGTSQTSHVALPLHPREAVRPRESANGNPRTSVKQKAPAPQPLPGPVRDRGHQRREHGPRSGQPTTKTARLQPNWAAAGGPPAKMAPTPDGTRTPASLTSYRLESG